MIDILTTYILPPLIGGIIGYFTNLIAVKMLFFPHEAKYIFAYRVPFTPGAIPNGKSRLAKSAGKIVQDELFTGDDIASKLLTEEVERPLIERAIAILNEDIRLIGGVLAGSDEKYDKLEANFGELLSQKITEAIERMDVPTLIHVEGTRAIREHAEAKPLVRAFVSDSLIAKIMDEVSSKIAEIIKTRGPGMVSEVTNSRIHDLGDRSSMYVLNQAGYDEEYVKRKLVEAYRESVVNAVNEILRRINVAQVVEDKINSMSVAELEKGVLAVMNTELRLIVNLGALIGLIIGCINIWI